MTWNSSPGFTPLGTVTNRNVDGVDDGLSDEEVEGRMILSLLLNLFTGRDGFVGVLGAVSSKSNAGIEMALVRVVVISSSNTVTGVVDLSAGCLLQSGQNQASGKVLMSTLTHSAW